MATKTGNSGNNTISGTNGIDTLFGRAGNDTLLGLVGNDRLLGESGHDRLDGASGADRMEGGTGNDTYVVNGSSDLVIEAAGAGTDRVLSNVTYTLTANVENLTLTGAVGIRGTGNTLANTITGNTGNNTLSGSSGNDTLFGGTGNDRLLGGTGNDRMDGQSGNDRMEGGAGNDIYVVQAVGDTVVEVTGAGTDRVTSSVDFTLPGNVEDLVLSGTDNRRGTGNTLANTVTGNSGNNDLSGLGGNDRLIGGSGADVLDGGTGNDVLEGGTGGDTVTFESTDDDLVVDLQAGTATGNGDDTLSSIEHAVGRSGNDTLLGSSAINGLDGSDGDDVLDGRAGNDSLEGGDGNDTLVGGLGNDANVGGAGDDTFDVSATTLGVVVNLALGTASGPEIGSDTLSSIESVLGGVGADTLTAGASSLLISGGDGNDVLSATGGFDGTADGGGGIDTLSFAGSNDGHSFDLVSGLVDAGFTVIGIERFVGGSGDDEFLVGAGNHELDGGEDFDELSYASLTVGVTIDLAGGTVTKTDGTDAVSGFEFIFGGSGDDTIIGSDADEFIFGGDGNDVFIPEVGFTGSGDDEFDGGAGIDTLDLSGQVFDVDVAFSGAQHFVLHGDRVDVENVERVITGSGDDTFNASNGDDFFEAGSGFDTLFIHTGNAPTLIDMEAAVQTQTGGRGDDTFSGFERVSTSNGDDTLLGSASDDILIANGGNDTLDGRAGDDSLIGGDDDDLFITDAEDSFINGGTGVLDTVRYADGGGTVGLRGVGIEVFDLTGGDFTLTFDPGEAFDMRIDGEAGDAVVAGTGWTNLGEADLTGYTSYEQDSTRIVVDNAIDQTGIQV